MPEERQSHGQQDALLDADRDNCRRSDEGKIKLARAFAANVTQTRHIDHPERNCEHDARQPAAWQVSERAGQNQQHQQYDARKYELCDLAARTRAIRHCSLRRAAIDNERPAHRSGGSASTLAIR